MTIYRGKRLMRFLGFSFIFFSFVSQSMIKALNTAASGMSAQEANVNTISNNIANVNTIGYKQQRAEFESLMYETIQESGARSSNDTKYSVGVQIGSGSKVAAIRREFKVGSPKITENPFDLMIEGKGFFGILMPDQSVAYTRNGSFNVNAQGVLVNNKGYTVMPGFNFPQGTASVNISANGQVDAYLKGQPNPINVGQIPVFTFTNNAGLKAIGGNLYKVTAATGPPIQNIPGENKSGSIHQGALETSNVSIMTEMTNLIRAQRTYEMNSKVMRVADEMLQTVNNIR